MNIYFLTELQKLENKQLQHQIMVNRLMVKGVNRLFILIFENETQPTSHKRYYFPTRKIKTYNVMVNGQNIFDQPVRNDLITYDSIEK